jgi:TRAP-type uncharacterized transport system fused permease subunit
VLFLIPFAFAFDPTLLWSGNGGWIAVAFASMIAATYAWAVALEGFVTAPIGWVLRALFFAASLTIIFGRTGTLVWGLGCAMLVALVVWATVLWPRMMRGRNGAKSGEAALP